MYLDSPEHTGILENADARGTWVSFLCGVAVRLTLLIDINTKRITDAKFKTNGCGFVIASAEFICGEIIGKQLTELHGLEDVDKALAVEFGEFPADRKHCGDMCLEALQNALAEYRIAQIEEWTGEKALICTCFGVSEERIENEIAENNLHTVEQIGEVCDAGTGCGSCQPLIQEILDTQGF